MTKFFSQFRKFFILAVLSSFFSFAAFGQKGVLTSDLDESFSRFDLAQIDIKTIINQIENRQEIKISTAEKDLKLTLSPRDLRAPDYRAEVTTSGDSINLEKGHVTTFKGKIADEPNSQVRISINGEDIEGFFTIERKKYFIEPASRYSINANEDDFVIYRSGDFVDCDGINCESEFEKNVEKGIDFFDIEEFQSPQNLKILKIATEADFELVNSSGGATQANNKILSLLNMIEGTYESDLNLTFSVVFQHAWITTTPYNNATPTTLLEAFKAHWQLNYPPTEIPRDLAYYFTGKANRAGTGLSKFNELCNPNNAYSLSGDINNAEANAVLMAHEIGHNVGATHADAAQSCANTIMNQFVSNITPLTFCSFTQNQVATNITARGGCLEEQSSGATRFDFDGDSRADISIFRPSNGVWYINQTSAGLDVFQFGQNGDMPVSADFDGDGIADAAVYRQGAWYSLNSSDGAFNATSFGFATDIPTPADYDGDGRSELAVFRPSNGTWYSLRSSDGSYSAVQFGAVGDIPVPGDFDGDGKADLTVFRPSNGVWYRLNSATGTFFAAQFGLNGDIPLKGDFDGDGKADLAVWRPSNGGWYSLSSATGSFIAIGFGFSTDIPVAADYDGDGKTDISVFRPSDGFWHLLSSGSNNAYSAVPFGNGDDIPVPSF